MAKPARDKGWTVALILALWALAAYLLYPLINLDRVDATASTRPTSSRTSTGPPSASPS